MRGGGNDDDTEIFKFDSLDKAEKKFKELNVRLGWQL